MLKNLKLTLIAASLCLVGAIGAMQPTSAIKVLEEQCADGTGNDATDVCESQGEDAGAMIGSVVNVLMFLLGAISAIMIVIGGIRYTTSNGDQGAVTSAKNTILYAVIGLVIAISASAIVSFVLSKL